MPLVAAINISSLSLKPFSVSKHTEKYSELDTCMGRKEHQERNIKLLKIIMPGN